MLSVIIKMSYFWWLTLLCCTVVPKKSHVPNRIMSQVLSTIRSQPFYAQAYYPRVARFDLHLPPCATCDCNIWSWKTTDNWYRERQPNSKAVEMICPSNLTSVNRIWLQLIITGPNRRYYFSALCVSPLKAKTEVSSVDIISPGRTGCILAPRFHLDNNVYNLLIPLEAYFVFLLW